MSLPALFHGADIRAITDRLNVLIRERNEARNPVSVDDLPDPTKHTGARRLVNDADSTTFWSVVSNVGVPENIVPVTSDGTDWRIG